MSIQHLGFKTLFLLSVLGGYDCAALAQDSQAINAEASQLAQIYETAYFENFAPRTAYDMLLRTPGFQLQFAESRRGLGQGGANVLLNGSRLSGKNSDPVEQLQQFSASRVVRIELVDGATSGIPGLSGRVANIITKAAEMSGTWSWRPIIRNGVEPNWAGVNVSLSGSRDTLDYALSFRNTSNRLGSRGPEFRRDGLGDLIEVAQEQFNGTASGPTLSGNLSWSLSEDLETNLGFEYSNFNINERDISTVETSTLEAGARQSIFFLGVDMENYEINADVSRSLGIGKAKIIGLYNRDDDLRKSVSERRIVNGLDGRSRFETRALTSEAILRAEYDWTTAPNYSWQIAGEYARNTLSFDTAFFSANGADPLTPVTLDDPNTDVSEDRFESTITYSRPLSAVWDLQANLGAEYSTLKQSGSEAGNKRSFFRPKGFLTLTYKPDESLSITSKIDRSVGQLYFLDFTSSIDLENDLDQTGNPNLVPQQSWELELSANKTFTAEHVLNVTLLAEDISDLVDRIPIGETGDGIGNIKSAKRYSAEVSATLKGEAWGWDGLETQLSYETNHSELRDPLGGFTRDLNNELEHFYTVNIAYDRPNSPWAVGGEIGQRIWAPIYRIRSVDQNYRSPFAFAYVEHKDVFGLKVRATVQNATDFSIELDREIYSGRRDTGSLLRTESRQRSFDPYLQFDITGQF